MALYDSVIVILLILLFTFFADHYMWAAKASKSIITALGLALGFGWEKCFDLAVDHAGDYVSPYGDTAIWAKVIMCIGLVAIVFPAWTHYILIVANPDVLEA